MKREIIHEKMERQTEGLEAGNEGANRMERTKIERHNNDVGVGRLGEDASFRVLGSFEGSSGQDQPHTSFRQNPGCFGSDSGRCSCVPTKYII